jgi:hypothetical protein
MSENSVERNHTRRPRGLRALFREAICGDAASKLLTPELLMSCNTILEFLISYTFFPYPPLAGFSDYRNSNP